MQAHEGAAGGLNGGWDVDHGMKVAVLAAEVAVGLEGEVLDRGTMLQQVVCELLRVDGGDQGHINAGRPCSWQVQLKPGGTDPALYLLVKLPPGTADRSHAISLITPANVIEDLGEFVYIE